MQINTRQRKKKTMNLFIFPPKGILSPIAGETDVLLVPNIEAGNLLGKSLTYFAGAKSAGIIMGAKCPIVLVSRADTHETKLYSIALGSIAAGGN
jgi:phosphotransacetylase